MCTQARKHSPKPELVWVKFEILTIANILRTILWNAFVMMIRVFCLKFKILFKVQSCDFKLNAQIFTFAMTAANIGKYTSFVSNESHKLWWRSKMMNSWTWIVGCDKTERIEELQKPQTEVMEKESNLAG